MAYNYYDCDGQQIVKHYEPGCGEIYQKEYGNVRKGAYIHDDYYATLAANPSNPQLWKDGISQGYIILFNNVKGTYDGGTAKESPGYGDVDTQVDGYDFVLAMEDPIYFENFEHYESVAFSKDYHLAFGTSSLLRITKVPVSASIKDPITNSTKDVVSWQPTFKWFQDFHSKPFKYPVGIF